MRSAFSLELVHTSNWPGAVVVSSALLFRDARDDRYISAQISSSMLCSNLKKSASTKSSRSITSLEFFATISVTGRAFLVLGCSIGLRAIRNVSSILPKGCERNGSGCTGLSCSWSSYGRLLQFASNGKAAYLSPEDISEVEDS